MISDTFNKFEGLKIEIFSFGKTGHAAALQLKQDPYLKPQEESQCLACFMQLEHGKQEDLTPDSKSMADMVLILGSDDDQKSFRTATEIIRHYKTEGILCYALLSLDKATTETDQLIEVASNSLLIGPDQNISIPEHEYLAAAVLNVLHPIIGHGMVGVDFCDIRTVLAFGKQTRFSHASASYDNRALRAVHEALAQLADGTDIRSLLCNITAGFDLELAEYNQVADVLSHSTPNDATFICCTTLDKRLNGSIQVGLTAID